MCLFFSSCVYLFVSLPRCSRQCQCLTMHCDSALNPKLNDPLCHRNIKETKILSSWGTSSYTNLVTVIRAWNPEDGMQFTVGDASIKTYFFGSFQSYIACLNHFISLLPSSFVCFLFTGGHHCPCHVAPVHRSSVSLDISQCYSD